MSTRGRGRPSKVEVVNQDVQISAREESVKCRVVTFTHGGSQEFRRTVAIPYHVDQERMDDEEAYHRRAFCDHVIREMEAAGTPVEA